MTLVYVSLVECNWSHLLLLLLLMDNLHDHLKSPQDPYVVVVLNSLCPSSVYRMPFHLAACCSRGVNSLIAGWELWKHTAQSFFHPQKPASSAKRKKKKTPPARTESQNTLTRDKLSVKVSFPLRARYMFLLSVRILLTCFPLCDIFLS